MAFSSTLALGLIAASSIAGTVGALMQDTPSVPTASVPAAAATGPREDTGAQVKIGTSVKDQRISGTRTVGAKSKTVDVLGGLGQGGVSV